MKRLVIILAVFLLVFGAVSVVSATKVDFKIGTDNSIVYPEYPIDPKGLFINHEFSSSLVGNSFELDENESFEFDYVNVIQIAVFDSETTSYDITAYLSFVLPKEYVVGNNGDGTIEMTGHCKKTSELFTIDFTPELVDFGNGGLFTVQLSPFTAHLETGNGNGKNPSICPSGADCYSPYSGEETITATVTLLKAPISVPEPSTFMLFGVVLIGAIATRRIKR